jgi:hypothetical protein
MPNALAMMIAICATTGCDLHIGRNDVTTGQSRAPRTNRLPQ